MFRPAALALAALLATTVPTIAAAARATAPGNTVAATYHPKTKRFCVRADIADGTAVPSKGVNCLGKDQWRTRGIAFNQPPRPAGQVELARN